MLSKDKATELSAVYPKPKDLEQMDNLVALCDHCAEAYLSDPTVEEYQRIYNLKRVLVSMLNQKMREISVQLLKDEQHMPPILRMEKN